jgi:hypothetical protein
MQLHWLPTLTDTRCWRVRVQVLNNELLLPVNLAFGLCTLLELLTSHFAIVGESE